MTTFDNIFKVESNGMKVSSMCIEHAKQLFVLYVSWITLLNDILVELFKKYHASQFSPHMTFTSLHI
jgi:hypothetical protein